MDMTIVEATEYILRNLPENEDRIAAQDLINEVHTLTGYSPASIRGTLYGTNNDIKDNAYINENFRYQKRIKGVCSACMVRVSASPNTNATISWDSSYESPDKERARREAFRHFQRYYEINKNDLSRPFQVITATAWQGLCVKTLDDMFGIGDDFIVHNCEIDLNTFQKYLTLGLPTINHFDDMVSVIAKNQHIVFDLVNFDCIKYLADKHHKDLLMLNELVDSIEFLCVTMCRDVRGIRNTGEWANDARERFYHFEDPSRAVLISTLSNFVFLEEIRYRRNESSREMGIFVFQGLR